MFYNHLLSVIFVLLSFSDLAYGQLDSTLLKGSKEAPQDAALQSGRYQLRQEPPLVDPSIKSPAQRRKSGRKRVPSSEEVKVEVKASEVDSSSQSTGTKPVDPPSVADQMKGLVLGEQQPSLDAYREQVHPDDVRLNRLEVNLVPGYYYEESKSTYSFRNYQFFAPFMRVGATLWLTPFIGFGGNYGTTTGADISESGSNAAHVPVTNEITNLNLDFRKFFGFSRKSNSMNFGVHYYESRFSVPGDSLKRTKIKSNGIGVHFEARFPVAPSYSWVLGGRAEPRLNHAESATAINLESGSGAQSSRVGINLGGELKLSRQNQIIWDLSFAVEKNQFSGSANTADPETGVVPTGVSVSHTQSLFSLGYRWGQ